MMYTRGGNPGNLHVHKRACFLPKFSFRFLIQLCHVLVPFVIALPNVKHASRFPCTGLSSFTHTIYLKHSSRTRLIWLKFASKIIYQQFYFVNEIAKKHPNKHCPTGLRKKQDPDSWHACFLWTKSWRYLPWLFRGHL